MKSRKRVFINGMNALLGGGQTYLLNLLKETPQADIFLALPDELKTQLNSQNNLTFIEVRRWNRSPLGRFLWENFFLPSLLLRLKIDVYFSPGGLLPFTPLPCKTVTAFRNMLPFSEVDRRKFPLGYKRVRYFLLRMILCRSFSRADAVIFISQYAKDVIDLALPKRFGFSKVIYHGVGEEYRKLENRSMPRPEKLPFTYVLYVSILNVYKSHLEVVEAWSELRRMRPTSEKLIFVGPEYSPYAKKVRERIVQLGLENEVLLLGKVPHSELPGYYQNAKANIFASTCENCPNILLEAMAAGAPVFCSDIEPMPEIAQSGARLFSPDKPKLLAAALAETLDSEESLKRMSQLASQRGREFSWSKTRAETWQLIDTVGEG